MTRRALKPFVFDNDNDRTMRDDNGVFCRQRDANDSTSPSFRREKTGQGRAAASCQLQATLSLVMLLERQKVQEHPPPVDLCCMYTATRSLAHQNQGMGGATRDRLFLGRFAFDSVRCHCTRDGVLITASLCRNKTRGIRGPQPDEVMMSRGGIQPDGIKEVMVMVMVMMTMSIVRFVHARPNIGRRSAD